jgi:16S rRNA (cytosine967-C5)-methyltransferase
VIRRVTEDGAYSNLVLSSTLGASGLAERDRRLTTDLAYGTLRRKLILDQEIERAAGRPIDSIDPPAASLLRLGVYQLRFTRIPDHAAVSETVSMAGPRHRGFVNAVLRRVATEPMAGPEGDGDDAVSGRTGLASWAVAELRRVLPDEEVEAAATALATSAELSLRTNTCRISVDDLERALRDAGHIVRRGGHHSDVLHVAAASPTELPGFASGWFTVQDEASVVVGGTVGAGPGDRVVDACAGPGGKAAHLACIVGTTGMVVGADRSLGRAGLVRSTGRRLGLPLPVLVQDARRPALRGGFDMALVDAPCSGLGAARRRPELLWRPEKERLSVLARRQVDILAGTADLVRRGGSLLYSVCTFPRAETDAVLRAFLARGGDFEPEATPGPDGDLAAHRLWPHRHGTDAMFYARLRRRG